MSVLEKAIRLAVEAHAGQVDKAGRPYILHPLAVMFAGERVYMRNLLAQKLPEVSLEEFMAGLVLHDVSEDHPDKYPLSFILAEFGINVYRIVDGLTRREGETYMAFIRRANEFLGSRIGKILDIQHNMGRIHMLPPEMRDIRRRYERALVVLVPAEFFLEEDYLGSSHLIRPEEGHEHLESTGSNP